MLIFFGDVSQARMNLKPKIYKKTLFIGNKKVFKFTKDYAKKFFHKFFWIVFVVVMLLSMVLGGIALTLT